MDAIHMYGPTINNSTVFRELRALFRTSDIIAEHLLYNLKCTQNFYWTRPALYNFDAILTQFVSNYDIFARFVCNLSLFGVSIGRILTQTDIPVL